jgi:hypothetical protein
MHHSVSKTIVIDISCDISSSKVPPSPCSTKPDETSFALQTSPL